MITFCAVCSRQLSIPGRGGEAHARCTVYACRWCFAMLRGQAMATPRDEIDAIDDLT